MSPAPERFVRDEEGPPRTRPRAEPVRAAGPHREPDAPAPADRDSRDDRPAESSAAPDLHCRRCRKRIKDLQMEPFFGETGLCFWCAYVDSQG